MQSNDQHTLMVADHGIDPAPMPDPGRRDGGNHAGRTVSDAADRAVRNAFWHDIIVWCGIPVIIVLFVRIFLVGCYVIPSGSMRNTIAPGDKVVTLNIAPWHAKLERGDIVVFKDPAHWLPSEEHGGLGGDYLIKRLIGLPGDVVECAGKGQPVTVNGTAIDESAYLRAGVAPSAFPFRVEVTAGHAFVMGDNRANSADSRYHQDDGEHGLVPIDDIVGVAFARYWPIARISTLDSHHDVFAGVSR
ncbi:signal peptidase I [Bifidobacterium sp. SO1]|uniref:signal peptidase I n=1 Tax=Bifidobacterium sp. SO1 TaxID=2809029 RepID=UPI001BDBC561|nr:signal peptidase I [Bifidobacterium sp. SO1]MBT1160300.1 signal peptidase I [Bifidobacterium sp. SO1]